MHGCDSPLQSRVNRSMEEKVIVTVCGLPELLKAIFNQIRLKSVTAVKCLPQTIETILVNVGYSTGYGRGTAQNLPQTATSVTIPSSSSFEGCRFAALSQNTSTANQFAFAHEYSWAHINPYAMH